MTSRSTRCLLAGLILAIPALVLPAAAWGQEAPLMEPLSLGGRLAVTASGFLAESESGSAQTASERISQQEDFVGLEFALNLDAVLLSGNAEERESKLETALVLGETTINEQNYRIDLLVLGFLRPYLGQNRRLREETLDGIFVEELVSRIENEAVFAGLRLVFPIAESFIPFVGYARGRETLAIDVQTADVALIEERYEFLGTFYEAGVAIGGEEGLGASLAVNRKENPRVGGQRFSLAPGRSDNRRARFSLGFGDDRGIAIVFTESTQERIIENLNSFREEQETISIGVTISGNVLMRFSQSAILRQRAFFLSSPAETIENTLKRNSLTLEYRF